MRDDEPAARSTAFNSGTQATRATAARRSVPANRSGRQAPKEPTEHRGRECGNDVTENVGVVRQQVAQRWRQREGPGAHRYVRDDVVREVRRRVSHAPADAARTKAAALTGRRHQPIVTAVGASTATNPRDRMPQSISFSNSRLTNRGNVRPLCSTPATKVRKSRRITWCRTLCSGRRRR